MKLDFSQFHPLDHRPASPRCRVMFGGTRQHLYLAWEFHRRDQVLKPLRRLLLCPIGRHKIDVWHVTSREGISCAKPCCRYCDFTREPTEAEAAEMIPDFRKLT